MEYSPFRRAKNIHLGLKDIFSLVSHKRKTKCATITAAKGD